MCVCLRELHLPLKCTEGAVMLVYETVSVCVCVCVCVSA